MVADDIFEIFRLHGTCALVTGGSRGLGLQIAEALGDAGARVLVVARGQDELSRATEGLRNRGIDAAGMSADVAQPDEIRRVVSFAVERYLGVDILVNAAGTTWGAPAEDYPLHAWDKVMALNVRTAFLFSQMIAKHCMIPKHNGRIIMMASIKGFFGNASGEQIAAYNASKAALINLTRALAGEWGRFGINVNAIAPGWFPSRMTHGTIASQGAERMAARAPLRRLGDDQDLKGTALLLASRAGRHITGQTIAVDGGVSSVGD